MLLKHWVKMGWITAVFLLRGHKTVTVRYRQCVFRNPASTDLELYFSQVSLLCEVCNFYSQVFVEAVCCSEHPEAVDDRPTTVVHGLDLDADLPWPRPFRSPLAPQYTRSTWGSDQEPLPTASQAQSNNASMWVFEITFCLHCWRQHTSTHLRCVQCVWLLM